MKERNGRPHVTPGTRGRVVTSLQNPRKSRHVTQTPRGKAVTSLKTPHESRFDKAGALQSKEDLQTSPPRPTPLALRAPHDTTTNNRTSHVHPGANTNQPSLQKQLRLLRKPKHTRNVLEVLQGLPTQQHRPNRLSDTGTTQTATSSNHPDHTSSGHHTNPSRTSTTNAGPGRFLDTDTPRRRATSKASQYLTLLDLQPKDWVAWISVQM